jgi:tripartite ATP-independent transporter DctM subunit
MLASATTTDAPKPRWLAAVHQIENWLLVLVLAAMVLLPVSEVLRRMGVPIGIHGADDFLRHLTLVAGMLGGMIAARENRLLSLSSLPQFLTGWKKTVAAQVSGIFSALVTLCLAWAAGQFVLGEMEESRSKLAYNIQTWWLQLALPIGFGVIVLRLLWHSAATWRGRALAIALTAAAAWLVMHSPLAPENLVIPALILLVVATVLGAPIFVTLGGTAAILFWGRGERLASLPLDHYDQVTNPILAMVPLFTLAGYFLAESGASKRLVRVFMAWFGHIRGGPAIVTALVCAFFTTFTGGSGVTILALGAMLLPVLLAASFTERHALGLVTGAGSLGILFPPCLPLILYALIAQVPVREMFLGGIVPGVVMVALVMAWGVWMGRHDSTERHPFNFREARAAVWDAKWELLLPVVAFVTFFSKFALPTEAAAVTALYALFTQTVVHRDLKPLRDVPRVTAECGLLVGGILLILGTAMGFTNFLITEHAPEKLVDWATATIKSPWVFLLALNLVLIFVGGLIEIYAAIVVVVPLLVPVGMAFGIDPVHLGIIFLANMELGYLAPPVGLNLLLASYRFNKPILTVMRAVIPMLLVQFVGVMLITYVPPLTTFLPRLFGH